MRKIYTQPRTETVATAPQQMLCASGGGIKAQISGYKQNTGGGFTQTYAWLAGIVCSSLLFLGTACSTANNPDQPKQQAELKPRTLIVTQTTSLPSPPRGEAPSHTTSLPSPPRGEAPSPWERDGVRSLPQATITENGGVLDALWSIGDEVFYRNLSYSNKYYDKETDSFYDLSGTLYADKAERIASFTGERVWCDETNQLALIYPALNPADFTFHDDPLTAEYTISVAGQNGTLATLAKDFHHIYGIASVVSVTETTANAELAEMKSLLTVCKFSFVDENDKPFPISSLEISIVGGAYDGTYPQQGTVSIAHNEPTWNVSVKPDWKASDKGGTPLTVSPTGTTPTEVYVALFPIYAEDGVIYKFTVTSGGETYTGTAKAVLNEGEFVPATIKLTKN